MIKSCFDKYLQDFYTQYILMEIYNNVKIYYLIIKYFEYF